MEGQKKRREKRKVTSRSTDYPTINLIKVYEIWAYILLCKQYSSKTLTHHIQSSDYYTFNKQLHKYQLISFLKLKIIANTDYQFLCTILCGSPESSTLFQASRPPTLWCGVRTPPHCADRTRTQGSKITPQPQFPHNSF